MAEVQRVRSWYRMMWDQGEGMQVTRRIAVTMRWSSSLYERSNLQKAQKLHFLFHLIFDGVSMFNFASPRHFAKLTPRWRSIGSGKSGVYQDRVLSAINAGESSLTIWTDDLSGSHRRHHLTFLVYGVRPRRLQPFTGWSEAPRTRLNAEVSE
jgi:hypothetical protein